MSGDKAVRLGDGADEFLEPFAKKARRDSVADAFAPSVARKVPYAASIARSQSIAFALQRR